MLGVPVEFETSETHPPARGRAAFKLLARRKLQHAPRGDSFNPQPLGEGDLPFILAWRLRVINKPRLTAAG